MATYAELQAAIADDLQNGASVSSQQIKDAITYAIQRYGEQRFWFNESWTGTFDTVADQAGYSDGILADLVKADYLDLYDAAGQYKYRLTYVDPRGGDDSYAYPWKNETTPTQGGDPLYWTILNGEVSLFPVPTQVYIVTVRGHFRLATLVNDTDTNAWTTHGFQLIRQAAKANLATNTTYDVTVKQFAEAAEQEEYRRLKAAYGGRVSRGRVTATWF